jgi:probable rRNA maturation factor
LIEEAVRKTLAREGRPEVEMSVALLGDDDIRELNRRYLGKDSPTDVLAFALGDGGDMVGDIYIGIDQARRQAYEAGVPLREELVRLAIHGALHVLGHDHPDGPEREESPMFSLQERLVRELLAEAPDS